jgi:hypothetical protein
MGYVAGGGAEYGERQMYFWTIVGVLLVIGGLMNYQNTGYMLIGVGLGIAAFIAALFARSDAKDRQRVRYRQHLKDTGQIDSITDPIPGDPNYSARKDGPSR